MARKRTKKLVKNKNVTRSTRKMGRVLVSPPQEQWVPRLPLILMVMGILLMCYWATHKIFYYRSLYLSRSQAVEILSEVPLPLPLPTQFTVAGQIDVGIEALPYEGQWQVSDTKATYLLGSARPGEAGNIIFYGHNKPNILGRLRKLREGEEIVIKTEDGKEHAYVVSKITQIEPTDVSLLAPTPTETLTVYTCSGFLDSKRFVVQAFPSAIE